MTALTGARRRRPYGRHPALVTSDRLADAIAAWASQLEDHELEAIDVVRCALDRIAEPAAPREPAQCGTDSGYRRHLRNGEPICDECRAAHSAALRAYRAMARAYWRGGS